jgi:hypothetical protein
MDRLCEFAGDLERWRVRAEKLGVLPAAPARAVWLDHAPTAQVVLDLLAHAVIPGR